MTSPSWLVEFSAAAWPAIAGHLWQATIVTGLCLLALPAFRNAGAHARYMLWALAFVRFAVPQTFLSFAADPLDFHRLPDSGLGMRLQQMSDTVVQVTQLSIKIDPQQADAGSDVSGHPEIYCLLTIIWVAGFALLLGGWWFRQLRFARTLRAAKQEAGGEFLRVVDSLKCKLGIRRNTGLRIVWQGSEAGVYGVWHPVLVLPAEMPRQLSPAETEAVLAHELVHVARWDNLWGNLQMILCCIFWFHPVIWLLDRRLTAERESSCDERVIAALRDSQAYVSGLIKMTTIGLGFRVAGVSPMAGSNLKRRIDDMKNMKGKALLPARILLSSIAVLTVLLYFVAAPLPEGIAQAGSINLTIENSDKSPLKIVSAAVEGISMSPRPNAQVAAQLISPKIVVQNNSDRVPSVYVLEFRKTGSALLYLNRRSIEFKPNGTDSIVQNEFLWSAGEIARDAGKGWKVRLISVAFKDGSHIVVHGAPVPPPPGVWEIPERAGKKPIAVGESIPDSKLIHRVDPLYPELAKKARVQGRVTPSRPKASR